MYLELDLSATSCFMPLGGQASKDHMATVLGGCSSTHYLACCTTGRHARRGNQCRPTKVPLLSFSTFHSLLVLPKIWSEELDMPCQVLGCYFWLPRTLPILAEHGWAPQSPQAKKCSRNGLRTGGKRTGRFQDHWQDFIVAVACRYLSAFSGTGWE